MRVFVAFLFALICLINNSFANRVIENNFSRHLALAKFYQFGKIDSCHYHCDSAFVYALQLDENYHLAECYQIKSHLFFRVQKLDSALIYQNLACDFFRLYPDSTNHYISEYNKGNIYLYLDNPVKALLQYKKVLRLIDENIAAYTLNGEDKINLNKAYCYGSLASVYQKLGDLNENLSNLLKSYKISSNIDSRESRTLQAITLGNIGNAYVDLGEYQLAEGYAISGMEMKKSLGMESGIGYNYQVLAKAALGRNKFDLALKYLVLSNDVFEESKNTTELNRNEIIKARCFFGQNKKQLALETALNLTSLFNENGAIKDKIELFELIGTIYLSEKDYVNAYKFSSASAGLLKEFYNNVNITAVEELVVFFEEEEKRIDERINNYKIIQEKKLLEIEIKNDKQKDIWLFTIFLTIVTCLIFIIVFVSIGNRKNKKINKVLNLSMDEKEILFKEVHHRVKNNFQIISSLLNLQQGVEQDSRSKKVLMDAQGRIQSMSLVHEMLYRRNEVKTIDFSVYSYELVDSIVKSLSKPDTTIMVNLNMKEILLDLEVAVPLGLILHEAVTNAVKYGFPNISKGTINIELEQLSVSDFKLIISDNGVGIPEDILNGNRETLGIELIKILCEQINGRAEFKVENGTSVITYFTT